MDSTPKPAQHPICHHKRVAASALGEISVCPQCAVVHLAIGHVTLRFTMDSFRDLAQLLSSARTAFDTPEREDKSVAPPPFRMPPAGSIQ